MKKVADHLPLYPNYSILHWKSLIPLSFLNLLLGEIKVSSKEAVRTEILRQGIQLRETMGDLLRQDLGKEL
jgi:hypothetical protein